MRGAAFRLRPRGSVHAHRRVGDSFRSSSTDPETARAISDAAEHARALVLHHRDDDAHVHAHSQVGAFGAAALSLHSFADGLGIGFAFHVSIGTIAHPPREAFGHCFRLGEIAETYSLDASGNTEGNGGGGVTLWHAVLWNATSEPAQGRPAACFLPATTTRQSTADSIPQPSSGIANINA